MRDVVIAGGGMVGATLGLALRRAGLHVAVVEAAPLATGASPSFDERTTALSNGSRRVFEALGVWRDMAGESTPIRRVHVSDRGRFAFARIDASELRLDALGFVIPNRVIGEALGRALARPPDAQEGTCEWFAPARVTAHEVVTDEATGGHCTVTIETPTAVQRVDARLLVAADGAQSSVRTAAGIDATRRDYGQTAVTARVLTSKPHEAVAYERFTAEGPIALLPLPEGVGLVWTMAPGRAAAVAALPDAAFLAELQDAFGWRLGRFLAAGARACYPLALTQSVAQIGPRLAILGNAAQGLHPIAGQGFNLAVRDVASLAELVVEGGLDAGAPTLLERYQQWRREDRRRIVAFTDGLVRTYGSRLPPLRWARDAALLMFDLSPPAKHALSRLSLGAAGRVPRLARGAGTRQRR